MTQQTIQILSQISVIQKQLAILQSPQNQINRLNATLAALQLQLTPEIEPDADSLAFATSQAGLAVTAIQQAASATKTTLAPIAMRQSAQSASPSIAGQ